MKKIYTAIIACFLFSSCQKTIENITEDLLVSVMTNGQWKITSFTKNSVDMTADFTGYQFQFLANNTVDAIKNGITEKSGTWSGNSTNRTIQSTFSNAVNPLLLINGTWNITNNSFTFVEATQTIGAEIKTLRLDKI
jgi:hypothetical protein